MTNTEKELAKKVIKGVLDLRESEEAQINLYIYKLTKNEKEQERLLVIYQFLLLYMGICDTGEWEPQNKKLKEYKQLYEETLEEWLNEDIEEIDEWEEDPNDEDLPEEIRDTLNIKKR